MAAHADAATSRLSYQIHRVSIDRADFDAKEVVGPFQPDINEHVGPFQPDINEHAEPFQPDINEHAGPFQPDINEHASRSFPDMVSHPFRFQRPHLQHLRCFVFKAPGLYGSG